MLRPAKLFYYPSLITYCEKPASEQVVIFATKVIQESLQSRKEVVFVLYPYPFTLVQASVMLYTSMLPTNSHAS
jgi:hypothetical protein